MQLFEIADKLCNELVYCVLHPQALSVTNSRI